MDLELRHMELVCRIHEAGSISKAARRLGVSQPSLTAALHRIEKAAGGRLFDRTTQGIEPTELGLFLLERARPLVNEVKELTAAVRRHAQSQTRGPLRIALAPTPYLGQFLTSLEATHQVAPTVECGFAGVLTRIEAGTLDAAVIGYSPNLPLELPAGVKARHLVEAEPCWVAMSESHRLAARDELDLAELCDEDWVAPPGGELDGTCADFEEVCRRAGFAPRIRYRLDDTSAITQLLQRTRAIIVAQPTCRRTQGVVAVPLRGDPMMFRTTLVWHTEGLSDADGVYALLVQAYSDVIGNNEAYPRWWKENGWAHPDPAW